MNTHTRWAHRQRVSTTSLTGKNSYAPDRVLTSGPEIHWISRPTFYQLSRPVTRTLYKCYPLLLLLLLLFNSFPTLRGASDVSFVFGSRGSTLLNLRFASSSYFFDLTSVHTMVILDSEISFQNTFLQGPGTGNSHPVTARKGLRRTKTDFI